MIEQERVKLLRGPYRSPTCRVGSTLRCRIRGKIEVAGVTDARIPRPFGIVKGGRSLIVCGVLVKAIPSGDCVVWKYSGGVTLLRPGPNAKRLIAAAGDDVASFGADRDAGDITIVAVQFEHPFPSSQVPAA
jgi:hypothetical protein